MKKESKVIEFRTIAESIAASHDPHQAALASFSRRESLRCQNKNIYHFEDGSFLEFRISYSIICAGKA